MARRPTVSMVLGVGRPEPKPANPHIGGPSVSFQLHDFEQVSLSVPPESLLDSEGNETGATVAFTTSDDTIVAVTDNGDNTALAVASPGAGGLGDATVTATVTNPDGTTLAGTFDITVIPGDVVAVNIVAGTPEAKP